MKNQIPRTGKILIPKIELKIKKKLKELNLKPEICPRTFLKKYKINKHRYLTPCFKEGKKFAFYARLHNNLDAKEKFLREIYFLEKLKETNLKIKKLVPKIAASGIERDFEWLLREYPPEAPLKTSYLILKSPLKILKKIVVAILEISKIPPRTFGKIKKFSWQNYLSPLYQDLTKVGIIKENLAKEILKFVKKNLSLVEKENKYFCHGDLNLGNILTGKENFWIIDWELIQINNFAYDVGYLWTHLEKAKKSFRQRLIKIYINHLGKEKFLRFKLLFPIVTSYLSLSGVKLRKGRIFYLNVLKNCLDFKKLIKT